MYAIEMLNITKTFGEIIANKEINLSVRAGEIHAIVGENGAGKSTLMNILYGSLKPDSGEIFINGNKQTISSPSKAIQLGIGMVHQHFMLADTLTVLENILLGKEITKNLLIDFKSSRKKILSLAESFGINIDLDTKIAGISIGIQQKVEILKLLYRNAEYLILDEPTSVLTPQETDNLFLTLNELKKRGKTIIIISHKLDEVLNISDTITVLKKGEVAESLKTPDTNKQEIARLMVGEEFEYSKKISGKFSKKIILDIQDLCVSNDYKIESAKNVSFQINEGEIFGVAGVSGNGQKELIEAITSLRKIDSGKILIDNKPFQEQLISHIPSDIQKNGIVQDFSIPENILLGRQREKKFSSALKIKKKNILSYSAKLVNDFDILVSSPEEKIKYLSGGNQQKVVVARELTKESFLLIADQPTMGLDIKATESVHNEIFKERNKGKAILLISSDLSEILKLSDRIGVMYKGKIVKILDADKTNEKEIGLYMTGV